MNHFHFLRPEWFLALIPLVIALWRLKIERQQAGNWRSVCDPALLPFLLEGQQDKQRLHTWILMAICGVLAITALAGPVWNQLEQPVFREQSALVIALDLSRSMDAADIKPSRLTRSHHKLLDILKVRKEGETALIVYAAQPFVVTPLTDDTATIASQVTSLTTDIMPNQGSRPELAIEKSLELLKQAGKLRGHLLLITDGVAEGSAQVLSNLLPKGIRLSILAVGTQAGAPIPQPQGGFLKDKQGQIVVPGLAKTELLELSQLAGGRYAQLTTDDTDINHLLETVQSKNQQEATAVSGVVADQWQEEGPWLLLLLLPLCALAFRRGYLVVVFVLLIPYPEQSFALDWGNLWSSPDQKAAQLLEQGSPAEAADTFQNPEWKAAAEYRAGQYQKTEERLKDFDTAPAHYNRGNALARQGKYPEAIQAYHQALELEPQDKDAKHNKELIEELLKEQEIEQDKNQQQSNESNQDKQEQPSEEKQDDSKGGENSQSKPDSSGSPEEPQQADGTPKDDAKEPEISEQHQTEKNDPQEAEASQTETEKGAEPTEEEVDSPAQAIQDAAEKTEQDKAAEQWLKRIPDDPSGLLRRKFRYQYQQLKERKRDPKPW